MLQLTPELAALCYRQETDPGPQPGQILFTDRDYHEVASHLLDAHGPGPLWVFAYGSLLWRPAFEVVESRRATAPGWQRAFCLEMRRWRGSPTQPGLMMGLVPGGSCEGLVQRIPDSERHAALVRLLRREIDDADDISGTRWINVEVAGETIHALTFWVDPQNHPLFSKSDISTTARILARACGHIGSGAEYLQKTAAQLEELAIHDAYLWQLQELVAADIRQSLTNRRSSTTKVERNKGWSQISSRNCTIGAGY